jgi:uncharacterized protein YkwD
MLARNISKRAARIADRICCRRLVLLAGLTLWLMGCAGEQTHDGSPPSASGQSASVPPADSPSSPASGSNSNAGLEVFNSYRTMAKLSPIKEDATLSDGDRDHARYLVKNYGQQIKHNENLGVNFHLEDTNRPAYTYAGFIAGRASDVVIWRGEETPQAAERSIDGWFVAPFHRFPLLSTHLDEAGYGEYCEAGACAAALNITSGGVSPSLAYHRRVVASGSFTGQEYGSTVLDTAIQFPPDGSTVRSGQFDGHEWPDPLTSCAGYSPPTGLPITVQLGSWVKATVSAFSVTANGAPIPTCGIDGSNYTNPEARTQEIARNGLLEFGAVILIPRTPLPIGSTCKVSATINGRQYNWSFKVAGDAALR